MVIEIPDVHYNLLEEAWIPVVDSSGNPREVNLLEVFQQAHEIRQIQDASPEFEFGMYRFLIALILDFYNLSSVDDIKDLLEKGQFDDDILKELETIRNRFDLFDPNHPFYQGSPKEIEKKDLKSVCSLFHHIPSGINPIFFNHSFENDLSFSAKICARALCALPTFSTAGGVGFSPSINGTPPIYELIEGKNLFQTLLLNTYTGYTDFPSGHFEVPWRSEKYIESKAKKMVTSYLHGLTWMPRYCVLIPMKERGKCSYSNEENQILINRIVFKPGWKFVDDANIWRDPNVAYRKTKKGYFPIRFTPGKDFWRDYGPLMLLSEKDYENEKTHIRYNRPTIITQLQDIYQDEEELDLERVSLNLYVLESDKAKLKNWRRSILSLPKEITFSEHAGAIIQELLDAAELAEYYINLSLKHLYPRDAKGNSKGFNLIREQAKTNFWNQLHQPFEEKIIIYLQKNINNPDVGQEIRPIWGKVLIDTATSVVETILDSFDGSAEYLKKAEKVRSDYRPRIYGIKKRLMPNQP
ncbi:type I-E CRISPR-associated protein Cse1/CasA [Candidatus Harpocratesius sp.]